MNADNSIECVDELLKNYTRNSKEIVETKITRLTGPGENYGSILLKVDITLKNKKDGSSETLHTVAKIIPRDEFFQIMFNVQVSCKIEIAFYETIVPALEQFQKEMGVKEADNYFAKIYGARINLNGSDKVDENAVLLLENLKEAGYTNVSRFESFDLPTAKLVLKDLAAFHAVPVAMKLLKPEIFQAKIKTYLKDPSPPPDRAVNKMDDPYKMITTILETDEECRPLLPTINKQQSKMKPVAICERKEPFVTISHGDMWVNNIMVKFEDGKAISVKFLDFQMPTYQSPVTDLLFYLWTSVQLDVLEKYFNELLQFYYDSFIEQLQRFNIDLSPFSFGRFEEELQSAALTKLHQSYFMTAFVIFYQVPENKPLPLPHERNFDDIPEIARKRIILITKLCAKKGWLNV